MNSSKSSYTSNKVAFDPKVQSHSTEPELSSVSATGDSKAFEINFAINPLVSASAPLLAITTHLQRQPTAPNLEALHGALHSEVKFFEKKAYQFGYSSTTVLAARYFLCALIDETIFVAPWGKDSAWEQKNLLKTFQQEKWGGERFFLILERHCNDPKTNLHLLELAYLCLSIGFEGKYRNHPRAYDKLSQFIDRLYQLIRNERGEFTKCLFIASKQKLNPKKKALIRIPPIWLAIGLAIVGLTATYIPYYLHLHKLTKPVSLLISDMEQGNE